jgi:hypothetical protein
MATFNLKSLQLAETTTVHLKNADGSYLYADAAEKEPLEVEVYGRSSKQMRSYLIAAEKKKAKRAKGRKDYQPTPEESQDDNAEFFAAITKSVKNFDLGDGPLTTQEDFKKMYLDPALYFVVDQISETLGDSEVFMQK